MYVNYFSIKLWNKEDWKKVLLPLRHLLWSFPITHQLCSSYYSMKSSHIFILLIASCKVYIPWQQENCFSNVLPHHLEQYLAQSRYSIIVKYICEWCHRHKGREHNGEKVFMSLCPKFWEKRKQNRGKKG